MAANVIASALAIWALFRSVRDLRDALQPQMLQHTPCDVKGSLKGALRLQSGTGHCSGPKLSTVSAFVASRVLAGAYDIQLASAACPLPAGPPDPSSG